MGDHSSGIAADPEQPVPDGGEPVGLILRCSGVAPAYLAGDMTVFGDIALSRELYAPAVGALPIDGNCNMGPSEAAHACRLLGIRSVLPIHWSTVPVMRGSPDALERELEQARISCEVISAHPGEHVQIPAVAGQS